MPISDVYVARASQFANTSTSATPILSLYGTGAKRIWVVGVRVDIVTTAAAAGNNVLFQLCRSTSSNTATGTATGNPHDYSASASLGIYATTWSTPPAASVVIWEQELPQTTGSSWEEFPPGGYEWGVPAIANGNANAGVHLFVTQSAANSTTFNADLIWSE